MDINEIKDKVIASLGTAVDAGKDIAGKAADKAKAGARIAKLNMEISTEKENLRKTYIEIGKLYYDTHTDDPEGFFIQLCDEVAISEKNIADKQAEIEEIKAGEAEDISVEFENIVAGEESAAEEADEASEESACCGKDEEE